MTEAAAPGSAPAAPPAGGATPPGGSPPAGGTPPPAAPTRPEWLPETHWDGAANSIKLDDFGKHYSEIAAFHKTETEKAAALKARKPEDIRFEVKLPDTVKVPDGVQVKIDDKDPRLPVVRDLAIKNGWPQETVDAIVALDAQFKIEAHNAEIARVADEDKKLGEKGGERKAALTAWAKGFLDRKEITAEQYEELRMTAATAAGVQALEFLMGKINGGVPGTTLNPPPPPAPEQKSQAERLWPTGFSQQKAS